jgi:hypothetical protein
MKSLVLLSFLSLSQSGPSVTQKAEYFDNPETCQVRMQEIRAQHSAKPGGVRCSCHKTVEQVAAEGNDAI